MVIKYAQRHLKKKQFISFTHPHNTHTFDSRKEREKTVWMQKLYNLFFFVKHSRHLVSLMCSVKANLSSEHKQYK